MSNDGRSTAWIVGCSIAGILGMVLCGGGLVAMFWFSMKQAVTVAQSAQVEFADQMRATGFASAWVPPETSATVDDLFPADIEAWRLSEQAPTSEYTELGITLDGEQGAYESGTTVIRVYAYQVPDSEQSALFTEVADSISQFNMSSHFELDDSISHRMTFSYSPPPNWGEMWWCSGWLFVFITEDEAVDLESFRETYLTAIAGEDRTAIEEVGATPLGAGSSGAVEELERVDDISPE